MTSNNHRDGHHCETIIALIPEYAFGLTSAEDTRLVEDGLASCPEAAAQLHEFRILQDEMRASVPQVDPPQAVMHNLMTAARDSKRPLKAMPKPRKWQLHPGWLTAAAALVLFLVSNFYWTLRVAELERQNDNSEYVHDYGGDTDTSAFVLTSTNDLQWVRLPPVEEAAGANAFLMWNKDSKIGLLYVTGFPEPAAGKIYQLWLTRGDMRFNAGLFTVDENGVGKLLFRCDYPVDQYTWARITSEPETGSEQPGDKTLAGGEL